MSPFARMAIEMFIAILALFFSGIIAQPSFELMRSSISRTWMDRVLGFLGAVIALFIGGFGAWLFWTAVMG